ncbi:hypothetical protein, partial [Acidithiobacillus thiooxidans]|uniref:hypothetical protein n=1 Tax=Acidithiobacillus thiooxidans TaxID=930 RepID=UPI001C06AB2B
MSGRCWQEGILVLQGEEEVKKNGIRFWWPKILRTGIDPKTILTKKERKRLSNPPLRVGADQANAVFFQFHGKSSW